MREADFTRTMWGGTDINLAITFGTLTVAASILFSLMAGVLKILVFRRFRMDNVWFRYGPRQAWKEPAASFSGRALRRLYAVLSWLSGAAFFLGMLLFAIGFFVR